MLLHTLISQSFMHVQHQHLNRCDNHYTKPKSNEIYNNIEESQHRLPADTSCVYIKLHQIYLRRNREILHNVKEMQEMYWVCIHL